MLALVKLDQIWLRSVPRPSLVHECEQLILFGLHVETLLLYFIGFENYGVEEEVHV